MTSEWSDGIGDPLSPPRRQGAAPAIWMLSLADLLSLMLTFFVMLYAISSLELKKFEETKSSLADRLHPAKLAVATAPPPSRPTQPIELPAIAPSEYLYSVLAAKVEAQPALAQHATLQRGTGRVLLSLPADALLAPGGTSVSPQAAPIMLALAEMLGSLDNTIAVTAYADGSSGNSWEAAVTRALLVSTSLQADGYPHSISAYATGLAKAGVLSSLIGSGDEARRIDIIVRDTQIHAALQ